MVYICILYSIQHKTHEMINYKDMHNSTQLFIVHNIMLKTNKYNVKYLPTNISIMLSPIRCHLLI